MQANKLSVLPSSDDNIYPLNNENLEALLNYYFRGKGILDGYDLSFLYKSGLKLNQIEFIADSVMQNIDFFRRKLFGRNGITISNLMQYGLDALFHELADISGESKRDKITIEFFEIVTNRKVLVLNKK